MIVRHQQLGQLAGDIGPSDNDVVGQLMWGPVAWGASALMLISDPADAMAVIRNMATRLPEIAAKQPAFAASFVATPILAYQLLNWMFSDGRRR